MSASEHVDVRVNLAQIRANAQRIAIDTNVELWAIVKADAYGLGAKRVVAALADVVDGFCVFTLTEAESAGIFAQTGKTTLALSHDEHDDLDGYLSAHVRPAVWEVERATKLAAARPILSIDTGMQRFACPAENVEAVLRAAACDEAFTHATNLDQVQRLIDVAGNRGLRLHAAGSSLLHEPSAWLDAVRPGLALYADAVRVSTPLVDQRRSVGPIGYTGFSAEHHGVILAGYSHGLRPGPCSINGRRSQIAEVGMQSAYVLTTDSDRVGDPVVLLGDGVTESTLATAWNVGPHEVLCRLTGAGIRQYLG